MPQRLFLIDAMAQIYRAHFAFGKNPLINSKGENVSAIFGFTNILMALIRREKPDKLAVVYDSREPTFRHHIFEEYKATREKMPDELAAQLPRLDEVINALNLKKIILPGYEADDLIGTLAKQGEAEGYEVYLVTGDKDYYQLVTDKVYFYNPRKGLDQVDILGPEGVAETFGIEPDKVIDTLALMGDSSDNVPGVPKVGKKTALKLLHQYGSMESVINSWEEIGGKVGENLHEYRNQAILSKNLVTIRTEAPVNIDVHNLDYGPWNTDEARDLFAELEFRSLFHYLEIEPKSVENQGGGVNYKAVTNKSELNKLVEKLEQSSRFAFDTETTSKDPLEAELVGMSFSVKDGEAFYLPVNYFSFENLENTEQTPRSLKDAGEITKQVLDILKPLLEAGPGKIAQNAKYDFLVMRKYGINCNPLVFDPMLADYLLNPGARGHGIDDMALNYLKIKKVETSELIGKGKKQITMDLVPLETIKNYACEDADVALRLTEVLELKIEDLKLSDLLTEVELPLSEVLLEMEHNGIKLDIKFLEKMSKVMKERTQQLESECHLLAGTEFNLNSPKQLAHILFEKLNLPVKLSRKTKTGYSTDQDVLEKLAPLDPLPKKLIEYRMLQKLQGTYVNALPQLVNPASGRVHTTYNQAVAATGRLSSNDPNLQNIPIRTEEGAEIRKAFIAEKGKVLLSADYSQIELRMMAHLSNDEELIQAFLNNEDIHTTTASKIFKVAPSRVSKQQRSASKAVNFGVLFGMREFGLASRLGISRDQAREFIDGYFGAYPRVKSFIEELILQAKKDGFVTTILGRRRPIPELSSSNRNIKMGAERMTIATAVQGSAADLIKLAMIKLHRDLEKEQYPYKMLLQVHDELIFEIPKDTVNKASAWVKDKMESAMKLSVPLVVDTGVGNNWLEAH